MKTRIVYTKIWEDSWFCSLTDDGQKLFMYLITNMRINMCGIYECTDEVMLKDLRFKKLDRLTAAKENVSKPWLDKNKGEYVRKVAFYHDWVHVTNAQRLGGYKGKLCDQGIEKEKQDIPEFIKKCFLEGKCDTPSIPHERGMQGVQNNKQEIINNKQEIKEENSLDFLRSLPQEIIKEWIKRFEVTEKQLLSKAEDLVLYCESKKKTYSNYKSFMLKAVKKDFPERQPLTPIIAGKPVVEEKQEEITPEQRAANMELIRQAQKKILGKTIV